MNILRHMAGPTAERISTSDVSGDSRIAIAASAANEERTESARSLLFLLFFISGFAALIYQIIWQRALFAIYGINVQSITIIVSAFMLGLGLGSICGGYVSQLNIPLVAAFGVAELGTALFGFCSLHLFNLVAVHTAGTSTLATGVIAFLLLLIPTILMGSTLPILVMYSVRVIPNMGRWTGGLYYVNTLGSAIGCLIAATLAMKLLGESGCVELAAGINTLVGTSALVYYPATRADTASFTEPEPISNLVESVPFALAVAISGVNGLIALAYEIIWYRVYSFSTANKSATFAYVLGMYLLGIAIGALIAERICTNRQTNSRQQRIVGVFIVIGNLLAYAVAPLASYCNAVTKSPVLGFLLLPIGALLLGTVFPLICNISISPNAQAGKRMSQLYFSNIIGSILGSFVIGYLLMDFFSTAQVSLLLVATGVLAGLTLLVWGERPQWRTVAMLSLVSVVVVVGLLPTFTDLYLRLLPYYPVTRELEYLIENKSGVVAGVADRTVIGAGAYEGTFNTDPLHDQNGIFRAYALSVLHPAPKKVLQIGLATGSWAQVIVNNPSVEQLTIVEINPAYLSLIPKYPEVESLLSNPKVKIEIDDARRWLRRHPETFDAVVMNTIIHSHANATNLLSREYLELVKAHLKRGGIFYYNTTDSATAQITAATVLAYLIRVWNFVAVSESPIVLDRERWLNTMREYTIDGRPVLAPATATKNEALLQLYSHWLDQAHGDSPAQRFEYADTLRKRHRERTIVTDDNMACEWED